MYYIVYKMSINKKFKDVSRYQLSFNHKIREISFSGRINDWEKKFITNRQVLKNPSEKQKVLVDKMYKQYVLDYAR